LAVKPLAKTARFCQFIEPYEPRFPALIGRAGQPGPRAENRERGQQEARSKSSHGDDGTAVGGVQPTGLTAFVVDCTHPTNRLPAPACGPLSPCANPRNDQITPSSQTLRRRLAAIEEELHERTDNAKFVMPSDASSTSEHMLQKPQKGATVSHFFSGTRRLSGRRSCFTSHSVVTTFDVECPFLASQKASWRTCTGKRPAISAGVHYLPVSLSCATPSVRPGRLTTPRGVPCSRKKSPSRGDQAPQNVRILAGRRHSDPPHPALGRPLPGGRGAQEGIRTRRSAYGLRSRYGIAFL
jgi:hypothetical protein